MAARRAAEKYALAIKSEFLLTESLRALRGWKQSAARSLLAWSGERRRELRIVRFESALWGGGARCTEKLHAEK